MKKTECWVAVDKDGTEKASNNIMVRRKSVRSILTLPLFPRYSKNRRNKWADSWSTNEKDTLPFSGTELPKGSIEKLTGKKLTWKDEPLKL